MRRLGAPSTLFVAAGLGLLLAARPAAQQVQQAPPEQHAGTYSQADIQAGSVVYAAQCVQCHGPNGERITGVDLRSGRFRNATSDDDLRRIITNGLPGTSMIGQRIEGAQLTALVAFIRNMRDFNSTPVAAGDPLRGQTVFEGSGGCLSCHRVGGKGSLVAPDLTEIGTSRNAAALRQSLLEPTSVMMPINRPIRIVTKDGRTVTGRRLNEDTYSIQLITDQERLISVAKADLRDYQVLTASTMPSFRDKLSPQELADVVAYLGTLRPARPAGRQGGAPAAVPPAGR